MNSNNRPEKIVTRFAPSPTGLLHCGNYRTAIFSFLFARQHGGQFILRIEDTDRERSKKEYELDIIESLAWMGLEYDALYRQSERVTEHTAALERLIASGSAYISNEEAKDGSGRIRELVRFRNPGTRVSFDDLIRGTIEIDTTDLGDFVIAKNVHEPLFHLAVVVDDADMGVTHIVRGDDHIANTPRHLLLYDALGYPRPRYAHLPLVLDAGRAKLSKRRGALPLTTYRDLGYLPSAMVNYLALIGWNPGTEQEIFSREELLQHFTFDRVQKSAGIFNQEKLDWVNKEHIKKLSPEDFFMACKKFLPERITALPAYCDETLSRMKPIFSERISHFGQLKEMDSEGELAYFFTQPEYPKEKLFWKNDTDATKLSDILSHSLEILGGISESEFTPENVKNALWSYAEEEGRGSVLWPLRFALSGRDRSPDPFQLASIFGKSETLDRINCALRLLS